MRGRGGSATLVVVAALAAVGLVAGFVALGGADRLRAEPAQARAVDCDALADPGAEGGDALEAEAGRILLIALDDASCRLDVPREELVLALGRGEGLAEAAAQLGVTPPALEDAVLGSIEDAVNAEEAAGRLSATTALAVRTLVEVVPPDRLLAAVRGQGGACGEVPWKEVTGLEAVAAEVGVLTGLRAACALEIAPLEAVSALADPAGIDGLVARSGRPRAEVEGVVRTAIGESIAQATDAGALTSTEGSVLGAAAAVAPVDRLLAIVRGDDDPCAPFPWPGGDGRGQALAAIALIGVVDAACTLDVPTFDAFAALSSQAGLDALLQSSGKTQTEVEDALRAGLDKAVVEAQDADAISGIEALILRGVLSQVDVLGLLQNFVG